MKLTTVPSQIRPPRSEDWLIDGEKVGTISQHDNGLFGATVMLDQPRLNMVGWITGVGKTRDEAVTECMRRLSMAGYEVSARYTKIVAGIA